MQQLITSAATSLNQIAATYRKVQFHPGSINLDYGGGKYDLASEYLAGFLVENIVYDPFNRSIAHNLHARYAICKNNGADSVSVNNVLNVIAEKNTVEDIIWQCSGALKPDGKCYFLIHEGAGDNLGKATSKGWQRNEKTSAYIPEILKHFDKVERKSNLLIATGPRNTLDQTIFGESNLRADIDFELKKHNLIPPAGKKGKHIGGNIYLHQSAIHLLVGTPINEAIKKLPSTFKFDVVKFDPKALAFSFIQSAQFDEQDEPEIQNIWRVDGNGTLKYMKEKADPQIYHHKWVFVADDYTGFDIIESKLHSLTWLEIPCDKSRIGTKSFWVNTVESKLPLSARTIRTESNPSIQKRKISS